MDEIFIIEPFFCSRISGKKVLQPRNTDFKLTFIVLSHSSSEVSSKGLIIAIPALLTRTSILLYLSRV